LATISAVPTDTQALSARHPGFFRFVRLAATLLLTGAGLGVLFLIMERALQRAPEPIGSHAELFIEGARTTLQLTVLSGVVGVFLGIAGGLARLSSNRLVSGFASGCIWILRGTPLLVQILFVYFALPTLIPALKWTDFTAAAVALALNVGAYNAEVIRAGIQAVPNGQREAARSLGLSSFQTMTFIILPQAFRIVIPPLINNIVALLKDSSLASSIGLLELTLVGNRLTSETFLPVPVLLTIAAVYLVLTTAITGLSHLLEKRWKGATK
jgi:polar amino acid transport system permease protein